MEEGGRNDHNCLLERGARWRDTLSTSKSWLKDQSQVLSPYGPMSQVAVFIFQSLLKLAYLFCSLQYCLCPVQKPYSSFSSKLGAWLVQCQNSGWV